MITDKFQITVLPDGTIKSTTDEISSANHQLAEDFLKMLARLSGGESVRVRRTDVYRHTHIHETETERQF